MPLMRGRPKAGGSLALYGAAVWMLAFSALAMLFTAQVARRLSRQRSRRWASLLLYGSELFFMVKDVFFGGAPRLNTIFKLSYQAWMLLSLAGGATAIAAWPRYESGRSSPSSPSRR